MIQYSNQLISSDIPAPPDVEDLRYVDEPPELTFATANQDAIVDFYRKTLAAAGWKSTMDKMVDVDEKPTMIFRNPAKEMITLAMTYALAAASFVVSVRFQSAAEIAERDRRMKEVAPKLRAAAEAKAAKEAKEAAELAEKNKVPKVAVTLPADAKDVKQTNDSIKFTLGKGKAKAAIESLRRQFRDAGWKEDVASTGRHGRHTLFLKRRRAECDYHLQRHGLYADRDQSLGVARGAGSGEVKCRSESDEAEVAVRSDRVNGDGPPSGRRDERRRGSSIRRTRFKREAFR